MRPSFAVSAVLGPLVLMAACGDKKEACHTSWPVEVKLSQIQTTIFDRSCAFSGCHGNTNPKPDPGPALLLTAGKSYESLQNPATGKPSRKRVEPGKDSAFDSFLIEKLTSDMPSDGGKRQPPDETPLCDAEVAAIQTWIRLGAKND